MTTTTHPNYPRLRLRPFIKEDADRMVDIFFAAFDGDIHRVYFSQGIGPAQKSAFKKRLFDNPKTPETVTLDANGISYALPEKIRMVAELLPEDSDLEDTSVHGEIVGVAAWTLIKTPGAVDDKHWNADHIITEADASPGMNIAFANEFTGGFYRARRDWVGKKACLHLGLLVVDPKVHGTGTGTTLLKWGLDLADREGLPMFLESSPAGYKLYQKYGFEDVAVLDVDLVGKWGATMSNDNWGAGLAEGVGGILPAGRHRNVVMKREAKVKP